MIATPDIDPSRAATLAAHYHHCGTLVHEHDRDRWLASLFAPAEKRPHLHALYAFDVEITRIRDVISDPMPGEIRMQWWTDALEGEARGGVRAHPVADAFLDTIGRFQLPQGALIALIEAHRFDLYDDPMPDVAALQEYCEATSSVLFRYAAHVLAPDREQDTGGSAAARHAGGAYAICGLLRALPLHAARGQCFLPADLLARHGAAPADLVGRRATPGLRDTLADLRALVRHHLAEAQGWLKSVGPLARPALLPIAVVPAYLKAMERQGGDPLATRIEVAQWRRQWRLWRAGQSL